MSDVKNLHAGELTGTFTQLTNDSKIVSVEYMKLDKSSEQKLLTVLNAKKVTGSDAQKLFIKEICIKTRDAELFRKGQSSWIKEGNKYSFTSKSISRPRYKGDMKGLTQIGGKDYVVEAKIGNIEFDLSEQYGMISESGDVVIFENISAMLYPAGQYSVKIIN